ncbi:MAG TPA: 16S rRNA (cytidine(1402)-2'-O)-methyltransferase [Alphaproteobacteria bacterium]|jgi:16S rRNA (cytidine1402-2'-O)-methyltransferase|nr:16S rRNA (cytidine(1402)-2'-O)-methyltransferase [Alphaproteobacteria bacterium]
MRSPEEAKRAEGSEAPRTSKSTLLPGTLVIVATPIGNLGDMTRRAVDCLTDADVIACEDTRVTAKLLSAYGIKTPMLAYHEHNAARMRPLLVDRLKRGEIVALVSDAGTPLVSDPGYKLVEAAIADDIPLTAAPGASALLTALVLSGLPSDRFLFAGFLPPKSPARRTEIRTLAAVPATLIFYEAPQRLAKALEDLTDMLGPRPAAVARELTKRFEEVRRDRLDSLAAHYRGAPQPKGEIVILVGPPDTAAAEASEVDLDAALEAALAKYSVKEAAALVAAETGLPRRTVYARALALRADRSGE